MFFREGREREGKGKNLQLYDMNEKIQNKTAFPKLNSNVTPPEIRQYFHGVEKPNSLTYPKQIYAKGTLPLIKAYFRKEANVQWS